MPPFANSTSGGLGLIGGPRQRSASRRDQVRSDLAVYVGSHEIRLGADYQDGRSTVVTSYTGGQIVIALNDIGRPYFEHDFIARSREDPTAVDAIARPQTLDESLYIQDSWRPMAGLTVNAGFRWDRQDARGIGTEARQRLGRQMIPAVLKIGTFEDAVSDAARANRQHNALKRTKRVRVHTLRSSSTDVARPPIMMSK